MATKSFLKNTVIADKATARNFLSALEHAEGKKAQKVEYDKPVKQLKIKKQ